MRQRRAGSLAAVTTRRLRTSCSPGPSSLEGVDHLVVLFFLALVPKHPLHLRATCFLEMPFCYSLRSVKLRHVEHVRGSPAEPTHIHDSVIFGRAPFLSFAVHMLGTVAYLTSSKRNTHLYPSRLSPFLRSPQSMPYASCLFLTSLPPSASPPPLDPMAS
ncbi:hypothetical protein DENSPDRAFT_257041 [Dentipellis sp. KUC8613]|nr:hypothetical protein DENSPDRAFT_257041 [Dentipellis sp. KUC8613]